MTSQIDAAVAAAETAAANMTTTAPQTSGTALAPASTGGPVDMSLGSFLTAGGINPDKWLQVKDTGMKIDKNEKQTIDSFTGEIDFSKVKMFVGLRISLPGNKYEYIKSYDGRTESKTGQNWNVAVNEANARAAAPSQTYRGADILVVLDKDVTQGATKIPAGTKVGYTTSITGFAPFQSLLGTLVASGDVKVAEGDRLSGSAIVQLSHETKKNADYEWGIVNFEKA